MQTTVDYVVKFVGLHFGLNEIRTKPQHWLELDKRINETIQSLCTLDGMLSPPIEKLARQLWYHNCAPIRPAEWQNLTPEYLSFISTIVSIFLAGKISISHPNYLISADHFLSQSPVIGFCSQYPEHDSAQDFEQGFS